MYKLLKINNYDLPDVDKGSISVSTKDEYNTYKAENGYSTIESIRTGKINIDVSYKGLLAADIANIYDSITLVSSVTLYNPMSNSTKTISAKITDFKSKKIVYKNNVTAWSLSFKIEEL